MMTELPLIKKSFFLLVVALLLVTSFGAQAVRADEPPDLPHPRLYFTSEDLPELRALRDADSHQAMWNGIKTWADAHINDPPPSGPDPNKAIEKEYLEYMGFAYAITEDPDYAEAAKDWMLSISTWSDWDDGNWGMVASYISMGMSFGYDVLYDYLTPDERDTIRTAIVAQMNPFYEKHKDNPDWNPRYPNNVFIVTGGLGISGLALEGDYIGAADWINFAIASAQAALDNGGVDGGCFEGPDYATCVKTTVCFLDALNRVKGQNLFDNDFLRELPYYFIYHTYNSRFLQIEDSGWRAVWFFRWLSFLYRLASEYNDGYAQALANQSLAAHLGAITYDGRSIITAYMWKDPSVIATPFTDLPLTKQFRGLGYVISKTGWGNNDLLFIFKSGTSQGHAHNTQNEFGIYYKGKPLTCGPGIVSGEVDDTWSSNCILVNGLGQCKEPLTCPLGTQGKILAVEEREGNYIYILGDATAVYGGQASTVDKLDKWLRHVVFMEPNYFVIFDEIAASSAKRFDWLLQAPNTGEVPSLSLSGDLITLTKNEIKLEVIIVEPEEFDCEIISYNNPRGGPSKYIKVHPSIDRAQAQFLTVHYPLTTDESMLPTEKVSVNNLIGVKVADEDKLDLVVFSEDGNPVDEYIELGGIYEAIDGGDYLFEGTEVRVQFDSYQVLRLQESVDVTPPIIVSVGASNITASSVTITWSTDELATSQVDYGTTEALELSTDLDTTPVTNHSVILTDLVNSTTYYYKVKSEDGAGNLATSEVYNFITGGAPSDTTPPVITSVAASDITVSSATITWTTDEPATSQVDYGTTEDLGLSTDLDTSLVTNHSVILTDLVNSTTYYYKVKSDDGSDNLAASEVYNFTTLSPHLSISFTPPTDANNAVIDRNWTEINTSIDGTFGVSSFIDWDRSLVGYWNFNQNSGSTAHDKSTYSNNGTLINGPQWTNGRFGNALEFDSMDDYVDCGSDPSLDITDEITIEVCINPATAQEVCGDGETGNYGVAGKAEEGISGTVWSWQLRYGSPDNCRLGFHFNGDPEGSRWVTVKQNLTPGEWYHIVGTFDGTDIKCYLNGALKDTNQISGIKSSNAKLFIAEEGWHNYFHGLIDEVRIWDRALSEEEIEASYSTNPHSLSHKFTDLADGTYEYYAYATDLSGNSAETETRTLIIGTILPAISNISSSDVTSTSASITWTTDKPATSQVEYGTSEALGLSTDLDTTPVTNHSVILTDLVNSTTYHYKVKSRDAAGNLAASSNHNFATEAAASAPVADFSATPTSGDKPLNVQFTDESVGEITDCFWEFGDGGNSADENSSHSYTGAGSYSVSLTVTGPGGSNTETKVDYITVTDTAPLGDANGDGVINALDITKVKRIILELDAETPGADVNQDGKINALDITALEKLIMEQTP